MSSFSLDRRTGRLGRVLGDFRPEDDYGIVDLLGYGICPVDNWHERWVCAERFRGLRRKGITGRMCTFHRQSPINMDKPISSRVHSPERRFPLTDFASEEIGVISLEELLYFKSTYLVWEQTKNRYAPRPDRRFSTYDGRLVGPDWTLEVARGRLSASSNGSQSTRLDSRQEAPGEDSTQGWKGPPLTLQEHLEGVDLRRAQAPMSPTCRSEKTEDRGITSRWVQQMVQTCSSRSRSPPSCSCRSPSPIRRRSPQAQSHSPVESVMSQRTLDSFNNKFNEIDRAGPEEEEEIETARERGAMLGDNSALEYYEPQLISYNDVISRIKQLTVAMAPLIPPDEREYTDKFLWDKLWVDSAYFVCKDPCADETNCPIWKYQESAYGNFPNRGSSAAAFLTMSVTTSRPDGGTTRRRRPPMQHDSSASMLSSSAPSAELSPMHRHLRPPPSSLWDITTAWACIQGTTVNPPQNPGYVRYSPQNSTPRAVLTGIQPNFGPRIAYSSPLFNCRPELRLGTPSPHLRTHLQQSGHWPFQPKFGHILHPTPISSIQLLRGTALDPIPTELGLCSLRV
ncbi:hypothetical protein FB451DRAFT_1474505 [Mycena latifolia]|nr:hypothetical protein FB451DRAFT_1474505 [Mycena latifolia]